MSSKAKVRVATDMYEFIELEIDGNEEEIWDAYQSLKRKATLKNKPGLDSKEWNKCIDQYLNGKDMDSDLYERMNDDQLRVIQEIKKSFKRISANSFPNEN